MQVSGTNQAMGAAGGGTGAASSAPAAAGGAAFEQVLTRQGQALTPQAKAHAKAEKAAGDLVANALILPLLKQVRRSPWGENSVFSGGIGEKSFGPQFDIQIADHLAHSPRMAVTQVLTAKLEKRGTKGSAASAGKMTQATANGKLDLHG
jgi:hypothetical protein